MTGTPSIRRTIAARHASRALWASLLAIHVPITVKLAMGVMAGGASAGALGGLAVLGLSVILFSLKLIDVPYLRLPRRWHSFVAMCLVTAIVHHEALAPAAGETGLLGATSAIVVTAAVAGSGVRSRRLPRLRDLLGAAFAAMRRCPTPAALGLAIPVLVHGPLRVRPPAMVPRGPPC